MSPTACLLLHVAIIPVRPRQHPVEKKFYYSPVPMSRNKEMFSDFKTTSWQCLLRCRMARVRITLFS